MNVLWWCFVGLIAGAIARVLVPGHDRLGFWGTMLLGLVGSLIGGVLGWLLQPGDRVFSPAGFLGSVVGAIVALVFWRAIVNRRRATIYRRRS